MKIKTLFNKTLLAAVITASAGFSTFLPETAHADKYYPTFRMQSANACLPYAVGYVTIKKLGFAEYMHVDVKGLPPYTEFDFFVIQTPTFPFGLSWYQGDIKTNAYGKGSADFIGRFNKETFIVAVGSDEAPVVHKDEPNPDAGNNPATDPVHTFHLGLWFNSPDDGKKAGCPDFPTPFNGEHNAGIQVLNTGQYPKLYGPLRYIKP